MTTIPQPEQANGKPCGGAPAGNRNAQTSGWRSTVLGGLGKPWTYVTRAVNAFRNHQEKLAREHLNLPPDAPLPSLHERRINTAALWEQRGQLAQWYLRNKAGSLDATDAMDLATKVAESRERRDNALRELGLNDLTGPGPTPAALLPDLSGFDEGAGND